MNPMDKSQEDPVWNSPVSSDRGTSALEDLAGSRDPQAQLILFTLAGCAFGIPIRQVREILRVGNITRMPKAPFFLEGVIHLRGRITPVIDSQKRLGLPRTDRNTDSRILVVEWKDLVMGLIVDRVLETLRVYRSELKPIPAGIGLGVDPSLFSGLWEGPGREVLLLNLENMIRLEELKKEPDTRSGPQEE